METPVLRCPAADHVMSATARSPTSPTAANNINERLQPLISPLDPLLSAFPLTPSPSVYLLGFSLFLRPVTVGLSAIKHSLSPLLEG